MGDLPILAKREGEIGRITLNRPKALHALTLEMVQIIGQHLEAWADDADVSAILIDHAPDTRGFCAGADIRYLAESGAKDGRDSDIFFACEYRLNTTLRTYPKPIISLMDGITMGGGVGLSVHGAVRIATEKTVFAMPETGIGLFPDVGGNWFLPKLDGHLGYWLGLTGRRLKGRDVLAAGIATHFVALEDVARLKGAIVSEGLTALDTLDTKATLSLSAHLPEIDAIYSLDSIDQILSSLEGGSDWAQGEAQYLRTKSPLSMKLTLKLLRFGAEMQRFRDVMELEYRVASRLVRTQNFQEGVRAVLIDKDNAPNWTPKELADIDEGYLDAFIAPIPDGELWEKSKD